MSKALTDRFYKKLIVLVLTVFAAAVLAGCGTKNKVGSGKFRTIKPVKVGIVGTPKGVAAKVNDEDMTEIDVYGISKKSATVKVKLTYAGGVTKTVTVKVKKK